MAGPIAVETTVAPDGQIHISVPGLAPGQRVRISIEPEEARADQPLRAIDVINRMPGHLEFKTAAEVDAYIAEERDAWER